MGIDTVADVEPSACTPPRPLPLLCSITMSPTLAQRCVDFFVDTVSPPAERPGAGQSAGQSVHCLLPTLTRTVLFLPSYPSGRRDRG